MTENDKETCICGKSGKIRLRHDGLARCGSSGPRLVKSGGCNGDLFGIGSVLGIFLDGLGRPSNGAGTVADADWRCYTVETHAADHGRTR